MCCVGHVLLKREEALAYVPGSLLHEQLNYTEDCLANSQQAKTLAILMVCPRYY